MAICCSEIMKQGKGREYSLQIVKFLLQRAYAQEQKTETTRYNRITIHCSENIWLDPIKNGMSKAPMARSEQKNSQNRTTTNGTEQSRSWKTKHGQNRAELQSRQGQRTAEQTKYGQSRAE